MQLAQVRSPGLPPHSSHHGSALPSGSAEGPHPLDGIARDPSYSSSSCSFGFLLRSMPNSLPRVSCKANLPPSLPPPPPSPPPPFPFRPPPLPSPPPVVLYSIPLHTTCTRALGGGIVTLNGDDWEEVEKRAAQGPHKGADGDDKTTGKGSGATAVAARHHGSCMLSGMLLQCVVETVIR